MDRLIRAVERGDVPRQRIDDANRRIDEVISKYVQPPVNEDALSVVGCPEHVGVAERVQELAAHAGQQQSATQDPTEAWRPNP
jgi:hypothetical protein